MPFEPLTIERFKEALEGERNGILVCIIKRHTYFRVTTTYIDVLK